MNVALISFTFAIRVDDEKEARLVGERIQGDVEVAIESKFSDALAQIPDLETADDFARMREGFPQVFKAFPVQVIVVPWDLTELESSV